MSLTVRVIPCLDVDAGRVVKGVNFVELRDAGDPVELAQAYDAAGADELTFLDITATTADRSTMVETVRSVANAISLPLTVGGGIRSADDAERLVSAGAQKIGVNTAAINRPELIGELVERLGSGAVVVSIDARRASKMPSGYEVTTHGGSRSAELDAIEWARRASEFGAGEILLTSMDADGTKDGFDLDLISAVAEVTTLPIIASGGGGTPEHFVAAVDAGAAAVLAASVFHFGELSVQQVKDALRAAGHTVS